MTNDQRIAEITARCEQATPGPWEANWLDDCFIEPRICMIPANGCYDYDKFEANSEFIAHSREDIPYLLAHLAEQEKMHWVSVNAGADAIRQLKEWLAERDKELKRLQKEVASLAIESIEREKTLAKLEAEVMAAIDAVPVVRCKDCRFLGGENLGLHDCDHYRGPMRVELDDFCSYGERKCD